MKRRAGIALALAGLLCSGPVAGPVAGPDPVLIVDGQPIARERLEDWLLRERGALLAPAFARSFVVRQAAEQAGVALAPETLRAAVEAEIQERLAGAFAGQRAPWIAELASTERSEAGHIAERSLELESALLLVELARHESLEPAVLEERLWRDLVVVAEPALERPGPPDESVLRIGDAPVPRAQYGRWLRLYRGEVEARHFAEAGALRSAALAAGIVVTDEDAAARARADTDEFVRSFYGGDRDLWRRRLQREGRSEQDHLRQARRLAHTSLILEGLVRARRTLGEAELRAAYEERYGPGGEELRLRWIRIDVGLSDPHEGTDDEARRAALEAARARAREQATQLRARALEGQDFASLAERHSSDPLTAPRGGTPPEGFQPALLAPELQAAIAATPVGGVSAPTLVADSCWIFELLGRRAVPLDEARAALGRELLERPVEAAEAALLRTEILRAVRFQVLPALFEDAAPR